LKQKVRDLAHMLEILCLHYMKPAEHGPALCAVDRGNLPKLASGDPQQFISRTKYQISNAFCAVHYVFPGYLVMRIGLVLRNGDDQV
jgi:hypothetical protein